MKAAGVLAAIAAALALQTTLARYTVGRTPVDLVLVTVVYAALAGGAVTGLVTGTVGGLAQDALSSGIVGVGGLAKTLVGFVVGVIGAQFIVARPISRFTVFFAASVVHAAVFHGVYAVVEPGGGGPSYGALLGQAVGNAVVGVVAFLATEMVRGRRAVRARLR